MDDNVTWWVFFKRVCLGCAPQWWIDMLYGRAIIQRIKRESGKSIEQIFMGYEERHDGKDSPCEKSKRNTT